MRSFSSGALFIVLALAAICLGLIVYFATLPEPGSKFSEFYLLNSSGQPCDYPARVSAGQPFTVTVGVVNREAAPTAYTVRIVSGGREIKTLESGTLEKDKKWERRTGITLDEIGPEKKVEFYLFIAGQERPYIERPLALTLDVTSP